MYMYYHYKVTNADMNGINKILSNKTDSSYMFRWVKWIDKMYIFNGTVVIAECIV